jgi:SecD/SecF fusion protein
MSKNIVLSRVICAIVLAVLLVATVVGAYLGIAGRDTQMVTIHEEDGDREEALYRQVAFIPNTLNENWREAVVPSSALGGGYSYTITMDQGDMTDAEYTKALKASAKVLKARAELVVGDASTKIEDNQIVLTVPETSYNSTIATLMTPVGEYTLAFPNDDNTALGDAVMDSSDIKQSYYYTSSSTYYIQLQLTNSGISKFNTLLSEHQGDTIYLVQDGSAVAYATFYSSILSDGIMTITASDASSAFTAVACLRSGTLSAATSIASYGAAEAALGNLLNTVILVCGAALLLCCVWMLIRSRLAGLYGVFTLAAQVVLFCLTIALIAVSTGWKLGTGSLIVLVLCEAAFVYGLMLVLGRMASIISKGRGARAAVSTACGGSFKLLAILYGAILVVGLILMFAFQSGIVGILGRFVAISAILSVVMIYVYLRALLSCSFTLFGEKTALYK